MTITPTRSVLGARYELDDLIGRGGAADVYRARDRATGQWVAVKLLRDQHESDSARVRFTDEARMLGRLDHPGLVSLLDADTEDDQPYLVMQLVEGPSLADCYRDGPMNPVRLAGIGAALADATGYAHSQGLIHRDLKPGNVLLAEGDRPLLTDFGIARLVVDSGRNTATGITLGTAAYLAPEQVRGERLTYASDVYTLGLVLLEGLTGERAYPGSPTEAAVARLASPPAIPTSVPEVWHQVLAPMTELRPEDRPSAQDVARALVAIAEGRQPEPLGGVRPRVDPVELRLAEGRRASVLDATTDLLTPSGPYRARHVASPDSGAEAFDPALTLAIVQLRHVFDQLRATRPDRRSTPTPLVRHSAAQASCLPLWSRTLV